MRILLLILLLFILTGCGITEKEMRDKKDFCEDLGLAWEYQEAELGVKTEKIICVNKDE